MMGRIDKVISILKREYPKFSKPIVTELSNIRKDPYLVLISCLISLRTKDEVTRQAQARLFRLADTPKKMASLPTGIIRKAIYPAGFYITKASRIRAISKGIIENYNGIVPDTIDELLKFKGIGRKTANLVMTLGYGKPGICVDVHVHVMSNRLGIVKTKTAEQTEFALRKTLHKKYWIAINDLMVAYGQNICRTNFPRCGSCSLVKYCIYGNKDLARK